MPVGVLRQLLLLDDMYIERGQIIDSMLVQAANCDSISVIAVRALEREREGRQACDDVVGTLMVTNTKLRRSRRVVLIACGVLTASTLTAILAK